MCTYFKKQMPTVGSVQSDSTLCFTNKRLRELSNLAPTEGPNDFGFTPGCGRTWPPPVELGKELWGFPGALDPSYTWNWFPLIGSHVNGRLTASLESQPEYLGL